jgi:ferredoxin
MRVEVDFGLCEANGICMGLAPDVFDLDDDDMLHVRSAEVDSGAQEAVREAARQCPRQAIFLGN